MKDCLSKYVDRDVQQEVQDARLQARSQELLEWQPEDQERQQALYLRRVRFDSEPVMLEPEADHAAAFVPEVFELLSSCRMCGEEFPLFSRKKIAQPGQCYVKRIRKSIVGIGGCPCRIPILRCTECLLWPLALLGEELDTADDSDSDGATEIGPEYGYFGSAFDAELDWSADAAADDGEDSRYVTDYDRAAHVHCTSEGEEEALWLQELDADYAWDEPVEDDYVGEVYQFLAPCAVYPMRRFKRAWQNSNGFSTADEDEEFAVWDRGCQD